MDTSPKFCCVTLRNISNGHLYSQDFRSESEIRVLHGNSEAHNCIKEVLTGAREDETGSGKEIAIEEGFSMVSNLKEGHCTLFFCHSHSHSHSHNDIGNVYLLFLSKATG